MDESDDSGEQPPEPDEEVSPDELDIVRTEAKDVEKPEWLTEMDLEILEILGHNLVLTPSIIAENIDRSREGVSQRLNSLQAGGLVEKVGRGKYRITFDGLTYVATTTTTVSADSES